MQEFIFGTVAVDDLKVIHTRLMKNGLVHMNEISPRDPDPDDPVTITAVVGPNIVAERVACYYTTNGSKPQGSRGEASNGEVLLLNKVEMTWDLFQWGYVTCWQGQLPPQGLGSVVRYEISTWAEGKPEVYADWPDVKASTDRAAGNFFQGRPLKLDVVGNPEHGKTFTYHVDRWRSPQWAREAVLYQIFVDRFHPGPDREWIQTTDLKDFFGGTLWGILEKIDHIEDLGANCLWLSPVFASPTTHGYDATDLYKVAERLGGEKALRALVDEAHGRGMRVILDLVCNHVSNQHPYFIEAQRNPKSRYRDWFFFNKSELGYRAFFGVHSMPEVNLENPEARQWMLEVARFWLEEFDIDGYRLDHANGPGPSFWSDFWTTCKQTKKDSFSFGEIVEPANVLNRYVGRLDGTLDFLLAEALRRTFGFGVDSHDAFGRFLRKHLEFFPTEFLMLTFLDNHDMDRFLYIANGAKDQLRQAVDIQLALPGPPIIYYGSEVGLSQSVSKSSEVGLEASRKAMIWDERQDEGLRAFYKDAIARRKATKPWTLTSSEIIKLATKT
ncbi:MAG: alpha-amylase family glycosyl hydrolase [Anaerolineales bacterium]